MPIEITVKDRIATVLINRPEALNAIDHAMRGAVRDAWRRIATDGPANLQPLLDDATTASVH